MAHLKIKRTIANIWPAGSRGRKIILLYHSVGNTIWAMPEQQFCQQLNWLHDHCRVLSLTNLITAAPSDEIQVALTFDDGYQTLYDRVLPRLIEKKCQAMVYINTGWIATENNERRPSRADLGHYPEEAFLLWPEVKALHQSGWEIGSHGVNHYNFTQTSDVILQQELALSKCDIEKQLNTSCLHFSYPWGKYSSRVQKVVQQSGYQYAVAARHAKITRRSDLLALPRMNIANHYSFEDFKNIVHGKWDYLGWLHKLKGL